MKKATPSIITGVLLLIFGVLFTFMVLVLLDGFSESDGTNALIAYGIWTLLMVVIFAAGSGFAARFIATKMENVKFWIIATGMVLACSFIGSIAISLGSLIAAMVAEISRTS